MIISAYLAHKVAIIGVTFSLKLINLFLEYLARLKIIAVIFMKWPGSAWAHNVSKESYRQ